MRPLRLDCVDLVGHSSGVAGRDWKRLASHVVSARVQAGYPRRTQFVAALKEAGTQISGRTIGKLELGQPVSDATLRAVESLLGWVPGDADTLLDGGELAPSDASEGVASGRPVPASAEPTFGEALEVYRHALQQLRRVATKDRDVSAEAVEIIEDWELMVTALQYGGVTAVYRALADRYQKLLSDPKSASQAG